MKSIIMHWRHFAARVLIFFLVGISINIILCCVADVELINTLSTNMYTENAMRFITTISQKDIKRIIVKLDPELLVYYEVNSEIVGFYAKNTSLFPIPLISGKLSNAFCDITGSDCAAIGSRVNHIYSNDGKSFIEINSLQYEVVAVLGVKNVHTYTDYRILMPLSDSLVLNQNGIYVFDGSYAVVRSAMDYLMDISEEYGFNVQWLNMNDYGTLQLFDENPISTPIAYFIVALLMIFVAVDSYFCVQRCRMNIGILNMIGARKLNIVNDTVNREMIPCFIGLLLGSVVLLFRSLWFISTTYLVAVNAFILGLSLILFMLFVFIIMIGTSIKRDVAASLKW